MSTTSELAGAAEQLEQQEVLREVAAQRRRAGLQRLIDRILLTGAVLLLWELIVLLVDSPTLTTMRISARCGGRRLWRM